MDPELEVYSCDPVRGGPPAGRSSLDQVLDHVRAQGDEFIQDYLPCGFLTHEPAAEASVNSELRDRLKHERGAMRNLLLTNVHDPQGRPITHPVPNLTNLIIDMRQRMTPAPEQTVTGVAPMGRAAIGRRLRARIAYLRIQTISHYARRAPGDVNRQWALIDEQLQDLRARSSEYRRAFFKLIMELDDRLFGDRFFSELDIDSIRIPSEAEVLAKISAMQSDATQSGTTTEATHDA
ncbi:hypothetical protein PGT21_007888 [Puccinia graminis f. sp. tritici]|nr:hypothetical protein PGT21_007888 [Puccinia graminis f. sp. tritici]